MIRPSNIIICLLAGSLLNMTGCKSKDAPPAGSTGAGESPTAPAAENTVRLTEEQLRACELQKMQVRRTSMRVEIEVLGQIASDTDRVVQVRSDTHGTVKTVTAAVGDTVESGASLLSFEVEDVASHQIKELIAPIRAIVVGVYAEPGGHIDPAVPLVTLADISKLRCGLDVYEKDIASVRKGQPVRLKVAAFPNRTFEGRITYVSPRVDADSRTVKIRADVDNPAGDLKLGMFVKGYIQTGYRDALVVPEVAIQRLKGKTVVFKAGKDGVFTPQDVSIGETTNSQVEIKAGLQGGESIVTKGSFVVKSELEKGSLGGD